MSNSFILGNNVKENVNALFVSFLLNSANILNIGKCKNETFTKVHIYNTESISFC
jgi:hypothetical protein